MIDILFKGPSPHGLTSARDSRNDLINITEAEAEKLDAIRNQLETIFAAELGFGPIVRLNYTDGVRMYFGNGDVAHFRPSGNTDELRIYTVAHQRDRADHIAERAIAEPDGLLRSLEAIVKSC